MERVEMRSLDENAHDQSDGFIELRGGVLYANPPDSILLNNVLLMEIDVPVNGEGRRLDAVRHPRLFLHHLKYQFRGGYVRAGNVEMVVPDD